MKRLLALIFSFAFGLAHATGGAIPFVFATMPSGNVPASDLDTNFALIANYNSFSNYLVDTGVSNVYVVTFPAGTTGTLAAGLAIQFQASADNTGASTLAVNGMTAKNITNYNAGALTAGQIKNGAIVSVIYDGTQFKLAGQPGALTGNVTGNVSGTAATVTTAAQPNITSVGVLTGLTINPAGTVANITMGNGAAGEYSTITMRGNNAQNAWKISNSLFSGSTLEFTPSITTGGTTFSTPTMALTPGALAITGNVSIGANKIISSTAPTIASGFGTTPSILANNTAAFKVTVGTANAGSIGQLTMPAASNGWVCSVTNGSNLVAANTGVPSGTTTVNVTNFTRSTGSVLNWSTGDVLYFLCHAF